MTNAPTTSDRLQYIADAEGRPQAVVVPIDVWNLIRDRIEGQPDWPSPAMRRRIEQSMQSPPESNIPFEEALRRTGLTRQDIDAVD